MNEYDRTKFQTKLKSLLREHGYTNKELAEYLETTPTTVGRYISGTRSPDLETLVAIGRFLHVSLDDLCDIELPPKKRRPPDETILDGCYQVISDADRRVLWALLDRYLSPEQRIIINSMQDESIIAAV